MRKLLLLLVVLAMVAAACGDGDGGGEDTFLACQVTDTGGIDDASFNATAYNGMLRAEEELGVEIKYVESNAETDFVPNIQSMIAENCDVVITVGFLLGTATIEQSAANPDTLFVGLDQFPDAFTDNLRTYGYATNQPAFLAGYLSAGMTTTGTIATFGGINIGAPVTDFMDGFVWGAEYYNSVKGANVEVLGWNPDTKEGVFVGNFESKDDGRTTGQSFADEGADIILPVAGPVGEGTAALAVERGDMLIIGVDADWFETVPAAKSVVLTSILKKLDDSVFESIKAAQDGTFTSGLFFGGGGLTPYHDLDSTVPQELKDEVDALATQIADGSLDVANAG
jgi:basic membrane protein A